jgi:hypothetical protein
MTSARIDFHERVTDGVRAWLQHESLDAVPVDRDRR